MQAIPSKPFKYAINSTMKQFRAPQKAVKKVAVSAPACPPSGGGDGNKNKKFEKIIDNKLKNWLKEQMSSGKSGCYNKNTMEIFNSIKNDRTSQNIFDNFKKFIK